LNAHLSQLLCTGRQNPFKLIPYAFDSTKAILSMKKIELLNNKGIRNDKEEKIEDDNCDNEVTLRYQKQWNLVSNSTSLPNKSPLRIDTETWEIS
jgi:hypothetical protein